jgi:hypothetical protein
MKSILGDLIKDRKFYQNTIKISRRSLMIPGGNFCIKRQIKIAIHLPVPGSSSKKGNFASEVSKYVKIYLIFNLNIAEKKKISVKSNRVFGTDSYLDSEWFPPFVCRADPAGFTL